jgi:tRNA uridine 5-carbamoylmethylation protein Kti12
LEIPGLSTLYSIFKRNIDRENDVLSQRKQLASELMENCRTWTGILIETFQNAVQRWNSEGRAAAEHEIVNQEQDFLKLDYWSLKSSSPILVFLKEDTRFRRFADSCASFYQSSLSVKRIVYGEIMTSERNPVTIDKVGLKGMVSAWRDEVERMLKAVHYEYMQIKTITPK